jgi:predicted nucleotidyltransferase component of viral defense system
MMRGDASLKGRVKAIAKKSNLKPQELLQMYLFEHLLMRLEKSDYTETFVLKGGLLISSMIGVAQRTTMDMDTTVVGMDMDEKTVREAVSAVCAIDVGDDMEYSFERLEPIREGDEYANWRAHLRVRYGKIDAPIKIDITTGDEIVPGRIEYRYPLLFEEGSVRVLSYPLETVLAEKLETVVSRGIANTRGRDFYDIHVLFHPRAWDIDRNALHEAVAATALKRGSTDKMAEYAVVLSEVRGSDIMQGIWAAYVSESPYAAGLRFEDVVDSALELARFAMLDELG